MTPDEVRMLDNKYAILLIRGETPIIDEKFDTFKHKNFKYTEDGGYKPYFHGNTKNAVATLSIVEDNDIKNLKELKIDNIKDYDIIVDEEIDEYFENQNK